MPEEDDMVGQTSEEGREPVPANVTPLPSATWKPKPKAERDADADAAATAKKKAPRKMSFEDEMAAAMKRRQTQLDSDSSSDGGDGTPSPPAAQYSPHRSSMAAADEGGDSGANDDDIIAKLKHAADMEDARIAAAAVASTAALAPQDNRNTALYRSSSLDNGRPNMGAPPPPPPAHPEKSLVSSWMGGGGGGATAENLAAAGGEAAIKVGDLHTELIVEFARGSSGYGFSFRGGTDCVDDNSGDPNIYIATINSGGAADMDGRLIVGDRIIEANGTRLMEVRHDTVTEVLRSNLQRVKLKVLRATGNDEDIAAAIQQQEWVEQKQQEQLQKRQSYAHQYDQYNPQYDQQQQHGPDQTNNSRDAGLAPPPPAATTAVADSDEWRMSSFGGYETPPPEEDATADDANQADVMAEEVIELEKGHTGLGFTLAGGIGSQDGIPHIIVARIIPLKPASIDGRLKVDDRILEVNNTSFRGITQADAINVIKAVQVGEWATMRVARRCQRVHILPMSGRYGIALSGGAQLDRALFVKKIQAGSAAAGSELQEGDEIYRLNGHQGLTLTKDEANIMIKASADGLELMIHRKTL